jgi:hypothetical protein
METQLVDVTVHIDESVGEDRRKELDDAVRAIDGVVSVGFAEGKPHLMIVQYNPQRISSTRILERVKSHGVHAELVAL